MPGCLFCGFRNTQNLSGRFEFALIIPKGCYYYSPKYLMLANSEGVIYFLCDPARSVQVGLRDFDSPFLNFL